MTIPGIGPVTALTYKAEIFDPSRFKNSRTVGAYIGMTPTQYSSGETNKQGRISGRGSSELRSLLTEGGVVLLTKSQKWSKLKAWGLRLMRKKGIKKASLAVGRKLAVIMHRMLIDQKEFVYGEPPQKKDLGENLENFLPYDPYVRTSSSKYEKQHQLSRRLCSLFFDPQGFAHK